MPTPDPQPDGQMHSRQFEELYRLEDLYWWFIGRRQLVAQLSRTYILPPPDGRQPLILDAGCGTGGTMKALASLGEIHGADIATTPLEYCRRRGFDNLTCCRIEQLSYRDCSVDAITSCDVLEHIHDDAAALREMFRVLRPGGILVATLPAHPFLWSEHDRALSHLRRYTRREITAKLQDTGYRIEKFSAAVALMFPPILVVRLLQRLRPKSSDHPDTDLQILPPLINDTLISISRFETWCSRWLNWPVGTSFAIVARKPTDAVQTQSST